MKLFDVFVKIEAFADTQEHANEIVRPHLATMRINGVSILSAPEAEAQRQVQKLRDAMVQLGWTPPAVAA